MHINNVLAIDSSTNSCSVALLTNNIIYYTLKIFQHNNAIAILPMINEILLRQNIQLTELNLIAVAHGPGSFTGIRIAVGIAQGISIGCSVPLTSISTLLILAEQAWEKSQVTKVVVVIQANKSNVYWGKYKRNKKETWDTIEIESLLSITTFINKINTLDKNWSIIGTGWLQISYKFYSKFNFINIKFPNAKNIIPFISSYLFNDINNSKKTIYPNYLYNSIC